MSRGSHIDAGGVHYETADGQIEMMPSAKTHNVKEPRTGC